MRIFSKEKLIEIVIDVNSEEIEVGHNLTYTLSIVNQGYKDIRDIILDIHITQGVHFIKGEIQRERGILDFDDEYTGLIIGNLAPGESAKVIFEVKLESEDIKEVTCYGIISGKVKSNMVHTKVNLTKKC